MPLFSPHSPSHTDHLSSSHLFSQSIGATGTIDEEGGVEVVGDEEGGVEVVGDEEGGVDGVDVGGVDVGEGVDGVDVGEGVDGVDVGEGVDGVDVGGFEVVGGTVSSGKITCV